MEDGQVKAMDSFILSMVLCSLRHVTYLNGQRSYLYAGHSGDICRWGFLGLFCRGKEDRIDEGQCKAKDSFSLSPCSYAPAVTRLHTLFTDREAIFLLESVGIKAVTECFLDFISNLNETAKGGQAKVTDSFSTSSCSDAHRRDQTPPPLPTHKIYLFPGALGRQLQLGLF